MPATRPLIRTTRSSLSSSSCDPQPVITKKIPQMLPKPPNPNDKRTKAYKQALKDQQLNAGVQVPTKHPSDSLVFKPPPPRTKSLYKDVNESVEAGAKLLAHTPTITDAEVPAPYSTTSNGKSKTKRKAQAPPAGSSAKKPSNNATNKENMSRQHTQPTAEQTGAASPATSTSTTSQQPAYMSDTQSLQFMRDQGLMIDSPAPESTRASKTPVRRSPPGVRDGPPSATSSPHQLETSSVPPPWTPSCAQPTASTSYASTSGTAARNPPTASTSYASTPVSGPKQTTAKKSPTSNHADLSYAAEKRMELMLHKSEERMELMLHESEERMELMFQRVLKASVDPLMDEINDLKDQVATLLARPTALAPPAAVPEEEMITLVTIKVGQTDYPYTVNKGVHDKLHGASSERQICTEVLLSLHNGIGDIRRYSIHGDAVRGLLPLPPRTLKTCEAVVRMLFPPIGADEDPARAESDFKDKFNRRLGKALTYFRSDYEEENGRYVRRRRGAQAPPPA